jgi:hypothetical protein
MSISSGIDQIMDAYRGNPDALAQRYQQSKQGPQGQQGDLLELIALQRLKSEKEAAIRDMQLKMGGKPPTIADQREQQVMDMTKQEVVQEQAGVMQNKMREQQEAQKRLMQAAGAPQGMIGAAPQPQAGGIMNAMPQRPPSAGISGAAAPNMQRMAGGGIVAFDEGGNVGEEEARRAYAARRQEPQREAPRAEPQSNAQSGGLQAGLAALLGLRPEDVYRQRVEEVTRGSNYTPEERAAKERQIQERTAFDKDSELTNFLLGMAGRSTPGLAIAGGGAAAQNTRNQALAARQRAEGQLIDIGPESRMAGFKAAGEGERTAMTGLAQGTGDAVRLEQIQAAAARAGISPDDKRITQAYQALNMNPEIRALIKTREASGRSVDDPENVTINRRIYAIAEPIFRGRGLDPSLFIPAPPEASEAPAAQPGFWSMVGNALTPSFGGGASSPPPRRAPSGGVDPNNPLLRTN